MPSRLAALLLLAALLGSAAGRPAAPTPTERLNDERQRQQQAAAQQQTGRPAASTPTERLNADRQRQQQTAAQQQAQAAAGRRLRPPCFVPTSYYPYAQCGVSQEAAVCGRGYNAWESMAACCAPQRGALGAFRTGCTDLSRETSCWVVGTYHPTQTCELTTDVTVCIGRNWGRWATQDECCKSGRAFSDGCTKSETCWAGSDWFPERKCAQFDDDETCLRGWGSFGSEEECCQEGGAHSEGCGMVAGVN